MLKFTENADKLKYFLCTKSSQKDFSSKNNDPRLLHEIYPECHNPHNKFGLSSRLLKQ